MYDDIRTEYIINTLRRTQECKWPEIEKNNRLLAPRFNLLTSAYEIYFRNH